MSRTSYADRVAKWLLGHPWVVGGLLAAIVAVSLSALPRLSLRTGTDPFLDRTLPEYQLNEDVKARFVSDETLVIAYEAKDAFSTKDLQVVRALSQTLLDLRLPDNFAPVRKVDSLTTLKDLVGSDMSFKSEPLVPDPVPEDPAALAKIRERALKNPLIREHFLSSDLGMAALVVRLDPESRDAHTGPTVKAVRAAAEDAAARAGWTHVYLTGKRVVLDETSKAVARDTKRFIPVALAIMLVVLAISLRRMAGAMLVFLVMVVSLVVGVAMMPLLNVPATYMSTVLYPLIMMLACAEGIHYLSELGQNSELPPKEGAEQTLADLLVPATMCMFTTVVGFAAVGASSIPGLRDFALVSSVIVVVVFVVSFAMLALASRLRPGTFWMKPQTLALSPSYGRFVDGYMRVISAYPKSLVAAATVMTIVAGVGISFVVVDSNGLKELGDDRLPIRVATAAVEDRMAGIESLVISVRADKEDAFIDPAALRALDDVETYLRREEGMSHVASINGFIKLMHSGFFSEDPKEFRVPDTREAVAQLMLLNGDRRVDEFIDPARRWVRMTARYKEHSYLKQTVIFGRVQERLRAAFPESKGFHADVTGDSKTRVLANRQVVKSQTTGLGLAFVIIFGPIFLVLRSIKAGLLSIPSNIFPIVVILGLMGWLGVPITPQNTVMASITLGLVVDDSIHFLQHLRHQLLTGLDLKTALHNTLRAKLAAVWVSSVVFALGFGVLLISEFPPVRLFGLLTAGSMILGLVGELMVLPPLILALRPRLIPDRIPDPTVASGVSGVPGA